ncbi:Aldo/keto reductase [Laetiporus sulphureus 93-53]|uniref:Aldo/keto reductase n=1 Tax=Laetiporus sulphureus 93-53 TaxID=1314785 RepID=A0A165F2S4_9APHY|nr:Aldo/keto reductase [Laetiporus sulphureus 93-53]KZT08252.1 Aldo/keto reductase [Laetiporus sulphureus 93-53]
MSGSLISVSHGTLLDSPARDVQKRIALDNAQVYRNESEAGDALRASGLRREDVYITTKYSGRADIDTSIKNSCEFILFHPYVLTRQTPIVAFGSSHGIVSEAYSVLLYVFFHPSISPSANPIVSSYKLPSSRGRPITQQPGGNLDAPLKSISERLNSPPEQVLLAWAKAKGVVVVTSSTKRERLEGYLKAGDLKLTLADIVAIDMAGLAG